MMHYGKNFTGNERFFGFCVDILALVARDVGFDYILDLVPDRKYGAKDPQTGEWNGMVAQLMKYVSINNRTAYDRNSKNKRWQKVWTIIYYAAKHCHLVVNDIR